ncbi:uncharacterized protein PRCAT00003607001 [Priceomyces carsonii]|uniref:uncharacterized protein n=1 Tax=Priceomyces carsonii TaxID=28549 RepID=UPI002ED7B3F8|nr:unnamed protein product [Priceomyces carsonii]
MTIESTPSQQGRKQTLSASHSQRVTNTNYFKCFQNYYYGQRYLKPNPVYITDVKPSVNHWQLRDLIQLDKRNGDLYYTKDESIRRLRRKGLVSEKHLKLDYFPRCYSHGANGVIVTGGLITSSSNIFSMNVESLSYPLSLNTRSSRPSKGLFSFYNPELDVRRTFKVGEMINNSVSISQYSNNQFKSYVCNNDSNLYLIDIGNNDKFTITNKIICEANTSLNNVVQCPSNGKILNVTGDSSSIFLVDPTSKDGRIKKIKTNHDSGFGMSYHPNGNLFATAFQDGTCLLYDIRYLSDNKPIVEIKSTRQGHQSGAFRCCKFSDNSLHNMLVVLEHVGRVHLIDLRNLNSDGVDDHQVIVFPFAIDQFASYKEKMRKEKDLKVEQECSIDNDMDSVNDAKRDFHQHKQISIYGDMEDATEDDELQFPVPLVYGSEYLTNANPKLFKNYSYQPLPPKSLEENETYNPPIEFNLPQWNSTYNSAYNHISVSPTTRAGPSFNGVLNAARNDDIMYDHLESMPPPSGSSLESATSSNSAYRNYCQDSYQQSVNHIHGEMELSGVDWFDRKLMIGCEEGGVLSWDVNDMARRSFGSFSYA